MGRLTDPTLSAFCHISQYGSEGYELLPRVMSLCRPLNLWAPSSALLLARSGLRVDDVLHLLDDGHVRILGRESWLGNPRRADSIGWEHAAWHQQLDSRVWEVAQEDSALSNENRRVVVVGPERGWDAADAYLNKHPTEVDRWRRILRSRNAAERLPNETLLHARRSADPAAAARRVIRDAYNHGDAFAASNARIPIFLRPSDERFMKLLADSPANDGSDSAARQDHGRDRLLSEAALAHSLLEVLRFLDVHSGGSNRRKTPTEFFGREGHLELVRWASQMCDVLQHHPVDEVEASLISTLSKQIIDARSRGILAELASHPVGSGAGLLGMIFTVVGLAADPTGVVTLGGLAASLMPPTHGMLRHAGVAPTNFAGPRWPFLYCYGRKPTKRQVERVLYVLGQIQERTS